MDRNPIINEDMESAFETLSEDEISRAIADRTEEMKNAPKNEMSDDEKRKKSAVGHRERVRERFRQSGLEGFAPHEILELLLFYTIPMKDTKPAAHELIERFGSVSGVFDADVGALTKVKGITENSALLFKLIPQLISVYYAGRNKGRTVTSTGMLGEIFMPYFVGENTEKFLLACFDSDLRLLSVSEISRGASTYTSVELKKIMKDIVNTGCTMAAIAHNHPKGTPKPSDSDLAVTRRINELLKMIDVKLMDHIIIGGNMTYSMRDGGDLSIFD